MDEAQADIDVVGRRKQKDGVSVELSLACSDGQNLSTEGVEEKDKPQQQIPINGIKGLLTQDAELLLDKPEDVSDASDSVNCVLDEAHADSDDRDLSPVNYDTDTSEAQPPIVFAVHSGFLNGARKSPSMIDDSSLICSTDSLPSVVYKDDLLQNQKSQESHTRSLCSQRNH